MDHPDGMMQGMLLAWAVLLVVPTVVIGATVIWYVRHGELASGGSRGRESGE